MDHRKTLSVLSSLHRNYNVNVDFLKMNDPIDENAMLLDSNSLASRRPLDYQVQNFMISGDRNDQQNSKRCLP